MLTFFSPVAIQAPLQPAIHQHSTISHIPCHSHTRTHTHNRYSAFTYLVFILLIHRLHRLHTIRARSPSFLHFPNDFSFNIHKSFLFPGFAPRDLALLHWLTDWLTTGMCVCVKFRVYFHFSSLYIIYLLENFPLLASPFAPYTGSVLLLCLLLLPSCSSPHEFIFACSNSFFSIFFFLISLLQYD